MSEKLGRDAGAKVGALDYFENFNVRKIESQSRLAQLWHSLLNGFDVY